jgi:hypothetical protein
MYFKKKINVALPLIIWGDNFFDLFKNNFYQLIKREFNDTKIKYKKYNFYLDIWSEKKREISKIKNIKIRYFPINKYLKNNNNKYEIVKEIQKKIFSYYKNFNKVFLLYPDFIWKKGSVINLVKINKKIINVYCPQVIKEKYLQKGVLIKNFDNFVSKNLHPIVSNTIFNSTNKKNFFTAASTLYKLTNNAHLMKNFHLHPILFNEPKFKGVDFKISLDEDYYHNYILKNNIKLNDIYYQKNSKKISFASLESIKNHSETIGSKKNVINIVRWFESNCSGPHYYNSFNTFVLNGSNSSYSKEIKIFNKIFSKIHLLIQKNRSNNSNDKKAVINRLTRRLFFKNFIV